MLRERPRPQVDFKSRRNSKRGTKKKRHCAMTLHAAARVGRTQPLGRGCWEILTDKTMRMLTVPAGEREGASERACAEQRDTNGTEQIEGEE